MMKAQYQVLSGYCRSVSLRFQVWSLRSKIFWWRSSISSGILFLPFFFGFLHSLGQKFSMFYRLLFVFLSVLFRQSYILVLVLHNTWSNNIPTTDSDHNPSTVHSEHQQYFCGYKLLLECIKSAFIISFSEFLTVGGCRADIQLHLAALNTT